MSVKLQNYHWNVQGKGFFITHEKLEEYYDDALDMVDARLEKAKEFGADLVFNPGKCDVVKE